MTWTPTLSDVGIVLTAAGVAVGAYQLWVARKDARTRFDDSLTKEYRELASLLPVTAFLDFRMDDTMVIRYLGVFYRYIDLSNEQAFLHDEHRVSDKTWEQWEAGITSNLDRPGFNRAYSIMTALGKDDFKELRQTFPPKNIPDDELACLRAMLVETA